MKKFAASFLFAFCTTAAFAGANMQPGLWEITTKVEMAGMPGNLPPTTIRHCVKAADIETGRHAIPQNIDKKCEMQDFKVQGNTSSWSMVCKGENAMSGSGTISYSGNSYSGNSKMTMTHGGHTMNMSQTYSGKRLGDCP